METLQQLTCGDSRPQNRHAGAIVAKRQVKDETCEVWHAAFCRQVGRRPRRSASRLQPTLRPACRKNALPGSSEHPVGWSSNRTKKDRRRTLLERNSAPAGRNVSSSLSTLIHWRRARSRLCETLSSHLRGPECLRLDPFHRQHRSP